MLMKAYLGWGSLILFGVVSGAVFQTVFAKAIPLIRVVRHGQQAEGKAIRLEVPYKKGFRTPRPVIEFIGPDGHHVRYQDLNADKGVEKLGDTVTVRYDPSNPQGMATIRGMGTSLKFFWWILGCAIFFAGLAVVGLLILIGVIPVTSGS